MARGDSNERDEEMPTNSRVGWVDTLPPGKNYGFIKAEKTLQRYFFHSSDWHGPWEGIDKGMRVTFEVTGDVRPKAFNVRRAAAEPTDGADRKRTIKTIEPYSGSTLNLSLEKLNQSLTDISRWKLEAKLDDLKRYFFTVPELGQIISGDKSYVIGRKGTGKTALVQYISDHDDDKTNLVSKLTFKNFPFNELYTQENNIYTRPNQYITIWKLIIYSYACRSIARSSKTDPLVAKSINKAFPATESDNLGTIVGKWIAGDFGINILGTGVNVSNWLRNKRKATLQEKVENLEAFVLKHAPDQSIFILFDELDEDYKDIFSGFNKSSYLDLLTSLFKAVQDVRSVIKNKKAKVYPVIFLRDDIYDLIKDADKNKWRDLEIHLEWSDAEIKRLIAHRLARVVGEDSAEFEKLWYSIFSPEPLTYSGGKKMIDSYRYMRMSTQGRPRDYINYLRECAEIQLSKNIELIDDATVKDADKSYSNYLRKELIDEIHGLIPDIDVVLSIFSQSRKWILDTSEFKKDYLERVKSNSVKITDPDFVLRTLFYFSVIGNVVRPGVHIFRHERPDAQLNFKEKIVVHRGLTKSLQII